MTRLLGAVIAAAACALLVPSAHAADLATPTATIAAATPAATPSLDASAVAEQQRASEGGHRYAKPETFEGGLQIGTSANGAALLTFLARGTCTFNSGSLAAPARPSPEPTPVSIASFGLVPTTQKVTCPITGVLSGDSVFASLDPYDTGSLNYEALRLTRCRASSGSIECILAYSGPTALDPGPLTISYLVVR